MRRFLLVAVWVVMLLGITINVQPLKAQVYGQFENVYLMYNSPYQELPSDKTVIPATAFGLPPNWAVDLDDGYAYSTGVPLGFDFEFSGEVYSRIWICINGFVTFSPPPFYPSKEQRGLFIQNVSYPINVLAPFWGDHRFRQESDKFSGYMPSEIAYQTDAVNQIFTVQWKNLQIMDQTIKSSIGNFQVRIFGKDLKDTAGNYIAHKGDVEFCYGQIGGNTYDQGNLVVTRNATVGVKGDGGDFINGLFYETDQRAYVALRARTDDTTYTNEWTPSGGTEKRIRFGALLREEVSQRWGDGDADLSQAARHKNLPQNRFVTVNDARVIMRSMVTGVPLDSVRKRHAYHGDVNHNGRYWWPRVDSMSTIYWRDVYESDNLPPQVPSIKRVYYKVSEYDAALILHYLSARLVELPWLLDTIPLWGKVDVNDKATSINFGSLRSLGNNTYSIPVYVNGYLNGPLGINFNMNADINDISGIAEGLTADKENGNVVFAGSGEYFAESPIGYLTISTTANEIKISNIRFNDNNVAGVKLAVSSVNSGDNGNIILQNSPNPFTVNSLITVNVPEAGNYTLVVYDALGNRIKVIASEMMNPGARTFEWNGIDENGNKVESGVYVYKLTGNNVSESNKLIFNK